MIVRFTTFRHRTLFCRAKKKLKNGFKVNLDLTKSRFNLLKKANDHVKEIPAISCCYADVNCRLRVKFYDAKQRDIFFSNFDELRDILIVSIIVLNHLQPIFHFCTPLKH